MALPDVGPFTVQDGALGMAPPSSAKTQLKIGLAPKGLVNTLFGFGDTKALTDTLGKGGDLVEAAALALQQGGPIYCVNANPSTYGTVGAVTKVSSGGASTLAIAAKPFAALRVKCAVGGILATATVQTSTDGGATYGATQTSAATVMLNLAPFVTIAMAAGTYVAGDYWDIATDGTVTFTGTGNNGVTVSTQSPVDAYSVIVNCLSSGALGAATFNYSLDGGNTYSGTLLAPASGKYVIPDAGIMLTFTGSLVAAEQWTCTVTAASYSSTDLTNAMNAVAADSRTWGFVHVVGPASSAANAAALATTLQGILAGSSFLGAYRFARGVIEVPADTDANLISAFAATTTDRVMWAAGFAYETSPLNGRQQLVSSAWPIAARAAAVVVSEDLGFVDRGALPSVSLAATNTTLATQRDERATPGLDVARFTTLRTILGRPGVYITTGRLGAAPGSDYSLWQNGRVMDVFCDAIRQAALKYMNASIRVNADGTVLEADARTWDAYVTRGGRNAVVIPGDASDAYATFSRTQNVLSTQTLPLTARARPLGYAKYIPVDIGFVQVQPSK